MFKLLTHAQCILLQDKSWIKKSMWPNTKFQVLEFLICISPVGLFDDPPWFDSESRRLQHNPWWRFHYWAQLWQRIHQCCWSQTGNCLKEYIYRISKSTLVNNVIFAQVIRKSSYFVHCIHTKSFIYYKYFAVFIHVIRKGSHFVSCIYTIHSVLSIGGPARGPASLFHCRESETGEAAEDCASWGWSWSCQIDILLFHKMIIHVKN